MKNHDKPFTLTLTISVYAEDQTKAVDEFARRLKQGLDMDDFDSDILVDTEDYNLINMQNLANINLN